MPPKLSAAEGKALLSTLASRFAAHPERHRGLTWPMVIGRLDRKPAALAVIAAMEASGGEPDVIGEAADGASVLVCDCSAETPAGRRSLCYDAEALAARKTNKPIGSAVGLARSIGIDLLTEDQYLALQRLGDFDRKTSSWLATPAELRAEGGALFGDRRFGRVFVYHNGAGSYYAARGFRGLVAV